MLDLLLSAGGGGILGLVGAGFKTWMGFKQQKLAFEHQVRMAEQERQHMALEMDLAKVRGEIDLELQESEADAKGLEAAIKAEAALPDGSPWVTDLRGSVRPILTYALSAAAVAMAASQSSNPWNDDIIFMAMVAVGYWFGDRPPKRR